MLGMVPGASAKDEVMQLSRSRSIAAAALPHVGGRLAHNHVVTMPAGFRPDCERSISSEHPVVPGCAA